MDPSGMWRSKFAENPLYLDIVRFNPCSRGCGARSGCSVDHGSHSTGFNPCSRGCGARSRIESVFNLLDGLCFNPCSRGCGARSRLPLQSRGNDNKVSILVLVDVALEVRGVHWHKYVVLSFNPCSRGCGARSPGVGIAQQQRYGVSILVLVDVALEAG